MSLVREALSFERGIGSKRALGIYDKKISDFIEEINDLVRDYRKLEEGVDYEIHNGKLNFKDLQALKKFLYHIRLDDIPAYIKINLEDFMTDPNLTRGFDVKEFFRFMDFFIDYEDLNEKQKTAYLFIQLRYFLDEAKYSIQNEKIKEIFSKLIDLHGWEKLPNHLIHLSRPALLKLLKEYRSEEKELEEELFKPYFFIGKPNYKEVEIDGEILNKKYLEIENLYQVDPYDPSDSMAVNMMKIRAVSSGDGSQVYWVKIPVNLHYSKVTYDDQIKPDLRKYIDQNKNKA